MASIFKVARQLRRDIQRAPARIRSRLANIKRALAWLLAPNRYYYLGPNLALARLRDGDFLYVDPLDETVSAYLIAHGFWEPETHKTVLGLTPPGATVIEVGANIGYYTLGMARRVGRQGRVLALEANPHMANFVRKSMGFNGLLDRVEIIEKAASDTQGEVSFMVSRQFGGSGHILVPESGIGADQTIISVKTVRLDDIGVQAADIIRMDAEGSEPLILRGAERLLANPDIIVCMEWSPIQMRSRASVPELVAWLEAMNFLFWRIEPDARLRPIPAREMASLNHCDVVMSRQTPKWPIAAG